MNNTEQERRWQLILGASEDATALSPEDTQLADALDVLYNSGQKGRGSLGRSAPKVARWLGDIRRYFPTRVVDIIQKDAFERLDLKYLLLEPELLAVMHADVHLVADLISLRHAMPEKTLETARLVVQKIVAELLAKFTQHTEEAIRGAQRSRRRTHRPRFADIDWARTIRTNLRHYQQAEQCIIPETLVGYQRQNRRRSDVERIVLCIDQSGSMAESVVYSSIFSAVLASIPSVDTRLICFDTSVLDLSAELTDPVQVLFGVQLGGGTDINQAIAYCQSQIEQPSKTHLILVSDLYEGGNRQEMLTRLATLHRQGVNIISLLALSDEGRPAYDHATAQAVATMGIPVFACTPEQFPDLMATALKREDIQQWASREDLNTIHG